MSFQLVRQEWGEISNMGDDPSRLVVAGILLALIVVLFKKRKPRRRRRTSSKFASSKLHSKNIRAASFLLGDIAEEMNEGTLIARLRGIDPSQFEELLLEALKRNGHRIKRNKAYTGDGGIDGRVWISGRPYLIQAKRYRSAIDPSHVQEFSEICQKQNVPGLFIHTGRTGHKSRQFEAQSGQVLIVSGGNLIKLIKGQSFKVKGVAI